MMPRILSRHRAVLAAVGLGLLLAGCNTPSRMGMVKQPGTGLMFGSTVDKTVLMDPAFLANKRIKVTVRNTSGDPALDMYSFQRTLVQSYLAKGYEEATGDDFGIRVDINVTYSGQIQENMSTEAAMLGGAAGGIAGYRSPIRAGAAIGVLSGATLGAILGSYATTDTYIIDTVATIATRDKARRERKVVTFSESPRVEDWDDNGYGKWRDNRSVHIAAYAGGNNTTQAEVAEQVRQRLARIAADII